MIKLNKIKNGDYVTLKVCIKTPFHYALVGGFTKALNEAICIKNDTDPLNGYDHILKIEKVYNRLFAIHQTPPRAVREEITPELWAKWSKQHDLEVWRLDVSESVHVEIIKNLFKILKLKWNRRKQKHIGARYNWWSIIFSPLAIFGFGIRGRGYECASGQAKAALMEGIILSEDGENDPLVSPNNIINSNLLRKVYGEYREVK